MIVFMLMMLAW